MPSYSPPPCLQRPPSPLPQEALEGGVRPCFCSPATSQGLVTPQSSAPAHLRLALCWQPSSPSRLRLPTQQPVSCAPSEAWGALSLGRVWEGSGHEERGRTRAAGEETRRAPEVTGSRAVLEAILPGHPHPPSASQGSPSDGGREGSRRGGAAGCLRAPSQARSIWCSQGAILHPATPPPPSPWPGSARPTAGPHPQLGSLLTGRPGLGCPPYPPGEAPPSSPPALGRGLNLSRDATHQHKF